MKILIQNHSDHSGPLHGAERAILELVDDWAAKSPELEFVFISREPSGTFAQEIRARDWKVYSLSFPWWIWADEPRSASEKGAQSLADMVAVNEVRSIFRSEKPDVSITNTTVAPWTAIAASLEHVPHIWFAHEYGELGTDLLYRYGADESYATLGDLSELVVANSLATQNFLSTRMDPKKLVVQYPAVSSSRIRADDLGIATSVSSPVSGHGDAQQPVPFRIGVIGHLTEAKNQLTAAHAVKILIDEGHDVRLVMAGERDAGYWKRIESFLGANGLDKRVSYAGELSSPFALIASCDLILAPSRQESFGLVVLESQFLGKPVIATNRGGCSEIITDGETGFLVDTTSARILAEAITRYLNDPDLLGKHGKAGHIQASNILKNANLSSSVLLKKVLKVAQSPSSVPTPQFVSHWIDQLEFLAGAGDLRALSNALAKGLGQGKGGGSRRKSLIFSFPLRVLRKLGRETKNLLHTLSQSRARS